MTVMENPSPTGFPCHFVNVFLLSYAGAHFLVQVVITGEQTWMYMHLIYYLPDKNCSLFQLSMMNKMAISAI